MQRRLTTLRAQPRPSLCSSSACSDARMLRPRALSAWSRKSRSSRNRRKRFRTSHEIRIGAPAATGAATGILGNAVWAADQCSGSALSTPASSAPRTIEHRKNRIMIRFDVTVEAEIREPVESRTASRSPLNVPSFHRLRHRIRRGGAGFVELAPFLPGSNHIQPEFTRPHDRNSGGERNDKVEPPKYQQRRQQLFPAKLRQSDKHCCVEYAEAARRMAGKTEQCRENEHNRQRNEIDVRLRRHQQVHRRCAKAEVDHANEDLQQGQP